MLTMPSPRPWMPLYRRRAALAHTTLPRKAAASPRASVRWKRSAPGGALMRRLYALLRYPPALTFRLDELTAEAEAWSAERSGDLRDDS